MPETERLILRRYRKEDLQDLYEYLSDEEVVRFEPYRPMNLSETAAELNERIHSDEMIAVVLKENHKLIGNVYLGKREFDTLELGYVFNKNYWGKGYTKESCEALIQKPFQRVSTEFTQNAIPAILPLGGCWKPWGLSEKHILRKMCISGRTKTEIPSGRIPLFIPC